MARCLSMALLVALVAAGDNLAQLGVQPLLGKETQAAMAQATIHLVVAAAARVQRGARQGQEIRRLPVAAGQDWRQALPDQALPVQAAVAVQAEQIHRSRAQRERVVPAAVGQEQTIAAPGQAVLQIPAVVVAVVALADLLVPEVVAALAL